MPFYTECLLNDRDDNNQRPDDDMAGHWEGLTAPYLSDFADKSPEWWCGFISGINKRFDLKIEAVPVVDFTGYNASEF